MIHTSGQSHGSFRNMDAMPQSVSPFLTTYVLGAFGFTMLAGTPSLGDSAVVGAGAGAGAWALALETAASVAVMSGAAEVSAAGLVLAAGAGAWLSAAAGFEWWKRAHPESVSDRVSSPALKRAPST